jgi:ADP-ribosyl-[dinitrogen reductase] hydrolase
MLVECAIGDALGAGFEFTSSYFIRDNFNPKKLAYVQHPSHEIMPGSYTDDTQMSIAIAELILDDLVWDKKTIATYFLDSFYRDIRMGYSGAFYNFLMSCNGVDRFLEKIEPKSEKAGAVMRSSLIGLYPDIKEVKEKSILQATLTHDNAQGINSSLAGSLAFHYFFYDLGDKKDLLKFIQKEAQFQNINTYKWQSHEGKVKGLGYSCAQAAIHALMHHNNLADMFSYLIQLGGDVDSACAIVGTIATTSKQFTKCLSIDLYDNLENGTFGKDYLNKIDTQLINKFKPYHVKKIKHKK